LQSIKPPIQSVKIEAKELVQEHSWSGGKLRMSVEDMDRTISSNPFIFDQLKILGVGANVWDDVLEELFDEPFGNIPEPFGFLLADLSGKVGPQQLDYSRLGDISDHEYVRKLFRQSIEEFSSDPKLPEAEGPDCDKALEEYWAYRASLN
jgi:hypothetical protein